MANILITGGSDGIGKQTAIQLKNLGHKIWIVGRNEEKTKKLSQEHSFSYLVADLSSPHEVKKLAAKIQDTIPSLDILVNNAGGIFFEKRVTSDGLEQTLALNHFSYFTLSHFLAPWMARRNSGFARIVNVASEAHRGADLDFDNLNYENTAYQAWRAYQKSKLANILFTKKFAEENKKNGAKILTFSLHPGFVASKFGHNNSGLYRMALHALQSLFAISEEEGAKTSVYACTEASLEKNSGAYLAKSKIATPTTQASDPVRAEKLWDYSMKTLDRLKII